MRILTPIPTLILTALLLPGLALAEEGDEGKAKVTDKVVQYGTLPAAVTATLRKEAPGAKFTEIRKQTGPEGTKYVIKIAVMEKGKETGTRELVLGADGKPWSAGGEGGEKAEGGEKGGD